MDFSFIYFRGLIEDEDGEEFFIEPHHDKNVRIFTPTFFKKDIPFSS